MSSKELTIIHHPTHCEFFLNDRPIAINRKTYYQHIFRYQEVRLVTFEINDLTSSDESGIDEFWGEHTVNSIPFITASRSKKQLNWRISIYPLYREYMQLYEDHRNQVIMDYGCGPGADLTGFALYSNPRKIIGVDISRKALRLAQHRLALHRIDPDLIELYLVSDQSSAIPVDNTSVDYIYCEGVLHHTSYPERILREF